MLYAHDGRGLGHASRATALCLALRRLNPGLSALVLTGSQHVADLAAPGSADWLKLPSYATVVENGVSRGVDGPSGLSDTELGEARAGLILDAVRRLRPRLVLADHSPQGKHRELLPALRESGELGVRWWLGVRGVVGGVDKIFSDLSRKTFQAHYSGLLWYGDEALHGRSERDALAKHFGIEPRRIGMVNRLAELRRLGVSGGEVLGLTASLPWSGPATSGVLSALARAAREIGAVYGPWRIFVDRAELRSGRDVFAGLEFVRIEQAGRGYAEALLGARAALVFGGANSLGDVLAAGLPAVVLTRGMRDGEQERHASMLAGAREGLELLPEERLESDLPGALRRVLDTRGESVASPVDLDGAVRVADLLAAELEAT